MLAWRSPESGVRTVIVATTPIFMTVLERAERFFREMLKHPDGENAVAYLKGRGLTGITARDFGIGYATAGWDGLKQHLKAVEETRLVEAGLLIEGKGGRTYDRFRDRIMFPIRDTRGRVIGFGGRVLGDGQPKYLNSPGNAGIPQGT